MAAFVLVPGAWLGAWVWKKVTPLLEKKGFTVYPVTLTGMGDRVHLARDDVGMETGIQDVLNCIKYNDLDEIILVGHSFSGKIVASVADRVPDKVKRLINLDGYIPDRIRTPQGGFSDEFPVVGSTVPLPKQFLDVAGRDVQGVDREWLLSKGTPTPVRYFRDPITLSAKYDDVKRSYVFCSGADTLAWYMSHSPGKSVDEVLRPLLDGPYKIIDSGHWPMISKPKETAEALISLSSM